MPNPGGGNQFGNYTLQPGYGDVARQTRLTKAAPISGAPFAAHALETPRRAGKQAQRGKAPQPQAPPAQAAPEPIQPQVTLAARWQAIAAVPGASPLVQQLAAQANAA